MYVCMYVCMYIHTYVCMYVRTYIRTYSYRRMYNYTHIQKNEKLYAPALDDHRMRGHKKPENVYREDKALTSSEHAINQKLKW